MSKARNVRLSTGFEVPLDGDLLAIIEALYKEITLGNVLNASFETMRVEILSVIDQMSPSEQRTYLAESLFLNSVTYENEMLSAYVRRLGAKPATATKPGTPPRTRALATGSRAAALKRSGKKGPVKKPRARS